ncbi:MAG TPA: hypothetical protein VHW44_17585 [Pseudonocardiaceae bacterium]|nr:hypothetical protein [Pseudonocardiaceae bacterium]
MTTTTNVPTSTTTPVHVRPSVYSVPASRQWYAQASWINEQAWVTIMPDAGQTDCQWLYANGHTYPQTFAAWAQNGCPPSWSATDDGYPCQRTYGMQH